jgi:uncharacterized protein (DUF934 family)
MEFNEINEKFYKESKCICLNSSRKVKNISINILINPSEKDFLFEDYIDLIKNTNHIGIWFEKFTDGRGYSTASRAREFSSSILIHAYGNINEELGYFLKRSGFNFAHLPKNNLEKKNQTTN